MKRQVRKTDLALKAAFLEEGSNWAQSLQISLFVLNVWFASCSAREYLVSCVDVPSLILLTNNRICVMSANAQGSVNAPKFHRTAQSQDRKPIADYIKAKLKGEQQSSHPYGLCIKPGASTDMYSHCSRTTPTHQWDYSKTGGFAVQSAQYIPSSMPSSSSWQHGLVLISGNCVGISAAKSYAVHHTVHLVPDPGNVGSIRGQLGWAMAGSSKKNPTVPHLCGAA